MIRRVALLLDQRKVSCKLSSADSSQLCRVLLATHKTRLHSNSAHTLIGEADHPFAGVTRGQARTFPLPNMMRARTSASLPQLHDLWPFTTSAEVFMFISASVWPRPANLSTRPSNTQITLPVWDFMKCSNTCLVLQHQNIFLIIVSISHNRNFIKLHKLYYCLWSAWLCLFIIFGFLLRITSKTCSCWQSSSKVLSPTNRLFCTATVWTETGASVLFSNHHNGFFREKTRREWRLETKGTQTDVGNWACAKMNMKKISYNKHHTPC